METEMEAKVNCKARRVEVESQWREFDEAKTARTTRPLYTLSLSLSLSFSRFQTTVSNPSS
jgi:hypothetical protein